MNPPKIFISATSGDLSSARQMAKEALLTINCHPVEQTNFEPDWRSVTDMLRGKIGDCQALIHLVGFRYGAEPDPATLPGGTPRHSYTQMEYHLARELGLRVYTFLLPETYPFDVPAKADTPEQTQLQAAHRALIQSSPHLYEKPANDLDLRTRIIALQEQVISLEQEQQSTAKEVKTTRRWGLWAAAAIVLILGGICVWQWQTKKNTTAISAQMSQVQDALSRIQQNTDPKHDPISKWPMERLEKELAKQMNWEVEDLRALLTAGKTSLDALVSGQALLASGKAAEADNKFDQVLQQEQAGAQRIKQAWIGKAQIALDQVKYQQALDYRQKAAALTDKTADPLGWADAQGWVASLLDDLARYKEAEPLKREALRLREQNQGPNHPDVATALNNLAQLLKTTNRITEAEPLMQRALKIDEASYGPDHPTTATVLNNLAGVFQDTNRITEAEHLMRRAAAILENRGGEPLPNYATSLSNLAYLLQTTNRATEAEQLYRRALKIGEISFGTDHPKVATYLNNLAEFLRVTYRHTEAEPLCRRALKIVEASYGSDHPKVAISLNNLAILLHAMNLNNEAEPLLQRALKIHEASYGPDHPDVATDLNNLAQLLITTNRITEAEPLMQRALKIDEASYGTDHPNVAIRLNNLAQLLKATNRVIEAEPLMQRVVGIFLQFQVRTGHRNPGIVTVMKNYIILAREMKMSDADIHARLDTLRQQAGLESSAFEAIWQKVLAPNHH